MAQVLVVEDDPRVRTALVHHLSGTHTVHGVGTAAQALREVARRRYDAVVLDLGPTGPDGIETVRMLRGISDVPVVVATAVRDEAETVRLLNAGADDYLAKPFSAEHLAARLSAVLRRSNGHRVREVIRVGGLSVDTRRREADLDGVVLSLTRREFDLLAFLAVRAGIVVPRRDILTEVWGQYTGDDQTLDVHLSWLRRKLGERARAPRYLHTVRGVGVRLEPPA